MRLQHYQKVDGCYLAFKLLRLTRQIAPNIWDFKIDHFLITRDTSISTHGAIERIL